MADIALRIKADFKQAEKAFDSLNVNMGKTEEEVEKLQKRFTGEQIDKFTRKNKLNAAALTATRGATAGLRAETRGLQTEIQRAIKSGIAPNSEYVKRLQKDYIKLNRQLDKTNVKIRKTGTSFKTLVSGIIGAGLIERGVRSIGRGFGFIVSEARKIEDATAAFTPLMGGVEKAKELVKELNIAAAETPFQFQDINKAVTTLLPTMNGDIKKTIDTFKMLGDTAGGNAQKLGSITRGFTKAMLKGKVDMESLNMIAEAGVPIFNEMAKSMGFGEKQMTQFFKKISTGTVSTDELVKAFQKMTSEGGLFFKGMVIASKTTSGVLSTLSDTIAMTSAAIGRVFLPYLKEAALWLIDVSTAVMKWVTDGDNLIDMLATTGKTIAILGGFILAYKIGVLASVAATKIFAVYQGIAAVASGIYTAAVAASAAGTSVFTAAVTALTTAMKLNPIGLLVAGIAALIAGIVILVKNWDLVKWKAIDFSTSASITLLELAKTIRDKVVGSVIEMNKAFSNLPFVGKLFKANIKIMNDSGRAIDFLIFKEKKRKQAAQLAYLQAIKNGKGEKKAQEEMAKAAIKAQEDIVKAHADANKKKQTMSEWLAENQKKLWVAGLQSFTSISNAIGQLMSALNQRNIAMIDARMQKDLEAAGVAEQTQVQQAQKELEAAQETGNALDVEEKRRALVKAQIEEKYQKKRRKLEYESALMAWKFQMASAAAQVPLVVLAALKSGWGTGPGAFITSGIFAGLAGAAAGIQLAAVAASKPVAPKAETGLTNYTVPEVRGTRNDRAGVMVQGGETVDVTPRGESPKKDLELNIQIGEMTLFRIIQRGIDTGRINLSDKNIGRSVFAT